MRSKTLCITSNQRPISGSQISVHGIRTSLSSSIMIHAAASLALGLWSLRVISPFLFGTRQLQAESKPYSDHGLSRSVSCHPVAERRLVRRIGLTSLVKHLI